jgi:hypothetical protein
MPGGAWPVSALFSQRPQRVDSPSCGLPELKDADITSSSSIDRIMLACGSNPQPPTHAIQQSSCMQH